MLIQNKEMTGIPPHRRQWRSRGESSVTSHSISYSLRSSAKPQVVLALQVQMELTESMMQH